MADWVFVWSVIGLQILLGKLKDEGHRHVCRELREPSADTFLPASGSFDDSDINLALESGFAEVCLLAQIDSELWPPTPNPGGFEER